MRLSYRNIASHRTKIWLKISHRISHRPFLEISHIASHIARYIASEKIKCISKQRHINLHFVTYKQRFLSAQATIVASEQLFFTAHDVYNYCRCSLFPKNAEMLIFSPSSSKKQLSIFMFFNNFYLSVLRFLWSIRLTCFSMNGLVWTACFL